MFVWFCPEYNLKNLLNETGIELDILGYGLPN